MRLIGFLKIIWRPTSLIREMDVWWQYRQQTAVDISSCEYECKFIESEGIQEDRDTDRVFGN